MELEVVGPRVSVDRNGTADRGGGQLLIKERKLLVRARNLERPMGNLSAIDHIQLVDRSRRSARVQFVDGQVWNVSSEQGEDLTDFFRQLEAEAGRAALLRDPPRVSEVVRRAMTPARKRLALGVGLALVAYLPLRLLAGLGRPVGLSLAVLGACALLLGGVAFARRDEEGPPLLLRVRPLLTWPWLALALVLGVAGLGGYAEASARATRERQQARALAAAKARTEAARAQADALARERRAQADALAPQLLEAVRAQRLRDAKALYDRMEALSPGHPSAKQVGQELSRGLAELDERERVADVDRGIARARGVAADVLACENAKRVADAYALLRRARPSDASYAAAQSAASTLERCRKRVRSSFAQSADDGRRKMRAAAAAQVESALRRLGYPASVTLSGRASDVLRIEARELEAGAAERILSATEAKGVTFEAARTEEGFTRIELRGEKLSRVVKLRPVPAEVLVTPLLEGYGLESPLALPAAEP